MNTTVGKLRQIAQDILDQIEDYPDNTPVQTRCNTYGMGPTILEVYEGFIDYTEIIIGDDDDEDECDDEEDE